MNEYYLLVNGQTQGPYTMNQLKGMWANGNITSQTLYAMSGGAAWEPLAKLIDELDQKLKPRDRCLYIVLGLLFGMLGIHNFYGRNVASGAIQLILTLVGCFIFVTLPVVILWVILEVCTVKIDGAGVKMV